jgi:hypothetical protein
MLFAQGRIFRDEIIESHFIHNRGDVLVPRLSKDHLHRIASKFKKTERDKLHEAFRKRLSRCEGRFDSVVNVVPN